MDIENDNIPHFLKNDNDNLNQNVRRPPLINYNPKNDDIGILLINIKF